MTARATTFFDPNAPSVVLRSLFYKYDKDGSGQLSKEELVSLFQDDLGFTKEQSDAYSLLLDKDGNNEVSFEEFSGWLKSGEQFKNINDKSRYARLYQQLTSLGSIFQQTTFFTHYSEHLSMDASDYLYWFCDFCLSFGKILWSQKQNLQTIFTETTGKEFLILESVERFSRDLLSNHKEEEISLFYKYDKDGSGQLSKEELVSLFQDDLGFTKEQSDAYSLLLDKDGNNEVSFEEFSGWLKSGEQFKNINDKSRYARLKKAVDLFKSYDKDSSGFLDRNEFKTLFQNVGGKPAKLDKALAELDKDGNNRISFQEFLRWLNWVPLENF